MHLLRYWNNKMNVRIRSQKHFYLSGLEYSSINMRDKIEESLELLKSSNAINVGRESDDELEE